MDWIWIKVYIYCRVQTASSMIMILICIYFIYFYFFWLGSMWDGQSHTDPDFIFFLYLLYLFLIFLKGWWGCHCQGRCFITWQWPLGGKVGFRSDWKVGGQILIQKEQIPNKNNERQHHILFQDIHNIHNWIKHTYLNKILQLYEELDLLYILCSCTTFAN